MLMVVSGGVARATQCAASSVEHIRIIMREERMKASRVVCWLVATTRVRINDVVIMSKYLRHPGMFSPGFRYVLKLERQTDGRKTKMTRRWFSFAEPAGLVTIHTSLGLPYEQQSPIVSLATNKDLKKDLVSFGLNN
jgi:hypothetical protein